MADDIYTRSSVDKISDDAVPATEPGHGPSHGKLQPPPLVAAMSAEYRAKAEAKLRKKIDTRLLPMIILMYIMNYLDRNNIAAVRLAGLQDDLNLSSTQYQVSLQFILGSGHIAVAAEGSAVGSVEFVVYATPSPLLNSYTLYSILIIGRQRFQFCSWDTS
jgi:hypothetical protein